MKGGGRGEAIRGKQFCYKGKQINGSSSKFLRGYGRLFEDEELYSTFVCRWEWPRRVNKWRMRFREGGDRLPGMAREKAEKKWRQLQGCQQTSQGRSRRSPKGFPLL